MTEPIVVQGTLKPDGTLELDQKVDLPAGRVQVTVQPLPEQADDPFWQRMRAAWERQKASGHAPRTREEIDAAVEALREEAEEEVREAEQLHERCRPPRGTDAERPQ
jgi:hypothetical protein